MKPRNARCAALLLLSLAGCATLTEKGLEHGPRGVTESVGTPRRFALLVGIDAFDDAHFTPLRFAGDDARAFAAALTGYQSVRVLTARDETLKASILSELEAIGREATHPQDTIVVYVSSHGTLARRPGAELERVIVTRDTRLELLADTGLSVDRLKAVLEALPARRKALVLALCHSGKGKSALADPLAAQLAATKAAPRSFHDVSEGMLVLTACAFGETARESAQLGHDIYTYGLLEALKHGDRDGDGAVTALEAHDFARDATFALTAGEQRPTAEVDLVGRDPVVLTGDVLRTASPVIYSYAPAAEGLRLRVDGAVKGSLPGGVTLEAGQRSIVLENASSGAALASMTVMLRAGERLDLTEVLPTPPAWHVSAELNGAWALSPTVARTVAPPLLGPRLGLTRSFDRFVLRAHLGYLTGRGTLEGLGERVPFTSHVFEPGLGASVIPFRQLGLWVGVEAAWWLVVRDAATRDFRSVQVGGGPTASAELGWQHRFGRLVAAGAAVRAGVLGLPLETRLEASALLGATLWVSLVL